VSILAAGDGGVGGGRGGGRGGGGGGGRVSLSRFEAISLLAHGHMRALLTPIPNLSGSSSPYLGRSHTKTLAANGYLDPTQPPFLADPTGVQDCTDALQAAVEYSRRNYLALWLPSGEYRVSRTIGEWCIVSSVWCIVSSVW
jgi:hypothetical protein